MTDRKTYDNVFEALDMPYEAAALEILELVDKLPDRSAIEAAALIIRRVVATEHKRLRNILGFDVIKMEERNGVRRATDYDPYYNLEGARMDLERQKADKACISTIVKHQSRLVAFDRATKNSEGTLEEMGERAIKAWHKAEDGH